MELIAESNKIDKIDFCVMIKLDGCDDNTWKVYETFAQTVKGEYNIDVKLQK